MRFIRSLLFSMGMIAAVLVFTPISLLTFPLPFKSRYAVISSCAKFVIWWLKVTCNLRFEVEGRENIPVETSIIFGKHSSAWETFAFQCIFPAQTWVLKRELLFVPFFGWGLAMLRPVAIDRATGRKALKQLVDQGKERLNHDSWLVIFPEGTRMSPGKQRKFGFGAAMLAEKSGHPAVPVAHNAGEFWARREFLKKPGTIKVVIGKPIVTQGRKAGDINEEAEAWMMQAMERITGQPQEIVERK